MQSLKQQLERQINDSVTDSEQLYLSAVVNLITTVYEAQEKQAIVDAADKSKVYYDSDIHSSAGERYYDETFKKE